MVATCVGLLRQIRDASHPECVVHEDHRILFNAPLRVQVG